jgi:hypothetical protein
MGTLNAKNNTRPLRADVRKTKTKPDINTHPKRIERRERRKRRWRHLPAIRL